MAKIRQKTIAERVGVSATSVSLVLNNPDTTRVAAKTKKKILDHYRRHSLEEIACISRSSLVLVAYSPMVFPNLYEQYLGPIVRAAEQTAQEYGRGIYYRTYSDPEDLRILAKDPSVAGLIHMNVIDGGLLSEIRQALPVVLLEGTHTVECDMVDNDLRSSARDEVHYLRRRGHERIAFVGREDRSVEKPIREESVSERFSGYCEGLFAECIPMVPQYIQMLDGKSGVLYPDDNQAREMVETLMALPAPPTAVVALNDYVALGLMKAAREIGLRLPEDLSFVGCDDIEACKLFSPGLTTMHQKREEMGIAAVEILIERIERGRWDNPREVFCGTYLVERESVADLGAECATHGREVQKTG